MSASGSMTVRGAACEAHARSGPAGRELRAGLRRTETEARSVLAGSILLAASPQPSGWACDHKEQPSARGRLRAAAPFGRYSEFKIQDSKLDGLAGYAWHTSRFGLQPAESRSKRTCGTRAAGLRTGEAAARCGSFSEQPIHNSRFKINCRFPMPKAVECIQGKPLTGGRLHPSASESCRRCSCAARQCSTRSM